MEKEEYSGNVKKMAFWLKILQISWLVHVKDVIRWLKSNLSETLIDMDKNDSKLCHTDKNKPKTNDYWSILLISIVVNIIIKKRLSYYLTIKLIAYMDLNVQNAQHSHHSVYCLSNYNQSGRVQMSFKIAIPSQICTSVTSINWSNTNWLWENFHTLKVFFFIE